MTKQNKKYVTLAGMFLLGMMQQASAAQDSLESEILEADTRFFNAFNTCDLNVMGQMFSPDLEFYHDKTGLKGYEETMQATRTNCARKLGLVRTLDEDSHQVYPVKNFGAIQLGEHTFCHVENGKNDCGTFGFTTVWKKTESGWQMHRVTSYDH